MIYLLGASIFGDMMKKQGMKNPLLGGVAAPADGVGLYNLAGTSL